MSADVVDLDTRRRAVLERLAERERRRTIDRLRQQQPVDHVAWDRRVDP